MRWLCAAIIAGAIVAVAAWSYETQSRARTAEPVKSAGASTAQAAKSAQTSTQFPSTSPGPAERALDLAALRRSLDGRSDSQAETQRIVAFARFRDRMAAYAQDKDGMPAAERSQTAREILAALPEHVARNEILPVQAQALTAQLLADAEPDPVARDAQLDAAQRQWDAYSRRTVGPSPEQDPRFTTYALQSRDIVQQVQSSVPDPRQQQIEIAQRLQALRVRLFDHVSASDTH
jgi:phospholipase C accessory protein PlcR